MKSLDQFANILIHKSPVDMRKQINGLCAIVAGDSSLDLKSPALFVFTNRRRTHMKILYFDKSGFALWLKRLESSKFPWPKSLEKDIIDISSEDMELLLEGVNVWTRFEKVDFEQVI